MTSVVIRSKNNGNLIVLQKWLELLEKFFAHSMEILLNGAAV